MWIFIWLVNILELTFSKAGCVDAILIFKHVHNISPDWSVKFSVFSSLNFVNFFMLLYTKCVSLAGLVKHHFRKCVEKLKTNVPILLSACD